VIKCELNAEAYVGDFQVKQRRRKFKAEETARRYENQCI
jgi:hypothetical protein